LKTKTNHREILREALAQTRDTVDLDGFGPKIKGKVRDCYVVGDKRILISSDRFSAFDVILTTIPYKGKLLNDMAAFWFEKTKHIVKNHLVSRPHPSVFVGEEVKIIPIEVVVRQYLAGSSYRDYAAGKDVSGVKLPPGLKKSAKLEELIITPSTKAEQGDHDAPISESSILENKIVSQDVWDNVRETALKLFSFAAEEVAKRGLILVDTKYEFGLKTNKNGSQELVLADEVHTQDCSRYWIRESYQERFARGEDPEMLDKEFVRRQLIAKGYMGEGTPPEFSDDFRIEIAEKYIEAYEMITGLNFDFSIGPIDEKVLQEIKKVL